jgi:hypothetical protein
VSTVEEATFGSALSIAFKLSRTTGQGHQDEQLQKHGGDSTARESVRLVRDTPEQDPSVTHVPGTRVEFFCGELKA